jgi:hypothetical protein
MGSAHPKNSDGVRAVAAVCDRRREATPTLIERRYKTNSPPVAAVCDRRWATNRRS